MPNLRGASPVGRDVGGRSYAAQTVSRVIRNGVTWVDKISGVMSVSGGSRVSKQRRHGPTRSGVGSRMGCGSLGDYQFDEALAVVVAGSHAGGCRVTPRDDVGRAPFGGSSRAGCV